MMEGGTERGALQEVAAVPIPADAPKRDQREALDSGRVSRWRRWVIPGGFVAVLSLQILLVCVFPELPIADGPQHKYSSWVYSQLREDARSPLSRYFEARESWLYPNAAYSRFLVDSSRWMALDTSEKLGCAIYLIGLVLAFAFFCASFGNRSWTARFLLLTLTLNYLFFMGFMSFLWGAAFALVSMGAVERIRGTASAYLLAFSNVSLLLAFWSHLMAFALALFGIAALGILDSPRLWPRRLAGCLPGVAVALFFWPGSADLSANWQFRDTLLTRLERILSLRVATSFGEAEWLIAGIWGASLLVLILSLGYRSGWRAPSRRLHLLFLLLLLAAALVPRGAGSGFFIDDRVTWFCWLIGLSLISSLTPRAERALIGCAVLVALLQIGYLRVQLREFNRQHELFISGTEHMLHGSPVFTYLPMQEDVPGVVRPWASANARYSRALESPDLFFYQADERHSGHFPIRYTEAAQRLFPGEKPSARIPPGQVVSFAHYVAVWGDLRDLPESLRALQYETLFVNGPLEILIRPRLIVSQKLERLRAEPTGERRDALSQFLLRHRLSATKSLLEGRLLTTNLSSDGWTLGDRPAGIVAINSRNREVEFRLWVRAAAASDEYPLTLTLDDGESARDIRFESERARWVSLGVSPPRSRRLLVLWTDDCRKAGDAERRCLGVRLLRGKERRR